MNFKVHEIQGYIQTIYLIEHSEGLLLLDGCCRPDAEVVFKYIKEELNKGISDLKLVISTHAHPDHAGALFLFKKQGIPVAGPVDLKDWYSGVNGFFTYWVDILLTYLVAMNKRRKFKNILFPRKVHLDFKLGEGDRVPGFDEWKVLECPGHTGVDLTIIHDESKLAYVADNFVGSSRKVFRPYPIIYPEKYKKSLQRYLDLGVEDFLIAHHGRVKVSKKEIEELIKTTPATSRRHLNNLHSIFLKLLKSFLKKVFK